ncbi:MAG: hypothetical protein HY904_07005 [Deltaproteobacteria bacterium]|nr:hypothetical protein [Deltaproteobacteria bacterium]
MGSTCDICGGSGRTTLCPSCGGDGLIGLPDCYERRCDDCEGKGRVAEHACRACQPPADVAGRPR